MKNKKVTIWCWFVLLVSMLWLSNKAVAQADVEVSSYAPSNPVLLRLSANPVLRLTVSATAKISDVKLGILRCRLNKEAVSEIQKIDVYSTESEPFATANLIGSASPASSAFEVPITMNLKSGIQYIWLSVVLKDATSIDKKIELHATKLVSSKGKSYKVKETDSNYIKKIGIAVRKAGEDGVNTYRIPGLISTDKGTLIAVYDNRYNNSADLPEDIDVGMSRSTDHGQTWEPMKVVMDMGPGNLNGIGDPSVLFDPSTKTIWVAAQWASNGKAIWNSEPGLSLSVSAQYVLVSSTDDGLTWSAPVNITEQVKDPSTRIMFQGPGNGIAIADGKIIFPSQYWDASNVPYSTLIYSADHGKSWQRGRGAKSNTTESQIVETTPGTLMLNMRDNRGGFRSVATTTDFGNVWTEHATSYKALPDPICQGSLIKARVNVGGTLKDVLFFSNLNISKSPRARITVKASLDLGETWLPANQLLVDERQCFGYSSLVMIDENTIGLLYEGIKELYFVKMAISEIIKKGK